MLIQYLERKLIYAKVLDSTLSRLMATAQLKTLCFNGDAIKLIVDCTTAENSIKYDTLEILELYGLHLLIDSNNFH